MEAVTLDLFRALGYTILHGPDIAPGEPAADRTSYVGAYLPNHLHAAYTCWNPLLYLPQYEYHNMSSD